VSERATSFITWLHTRIRMLLCRVAQCPISSITWRHTHILMLQCRVAQCPISLITWFHTLILASYIPALRYVEGVRTSYIFHHVIFSTHSHTLPPCSSPRRCARRQIGRQNVLYLLSHNILTTTYSISHTLPPCSSPRRCACWLIGRQNVLYLLSHNILTTVYSISHILPPCSPSATIPYCSLRLCAGCQNVLYL